MKRTVLLQIKKIIYTSWPDLREWFKTDYLIICQENTKRDYKLLGACLFNEKGTFSKNWAKNYSTIDWSQYSLLIKVILTHSMEQRHDDWSACVCVYISVWAIRWKGSAVTGTHSLWSDLKLCVCVCVCVRRRVIGSWSESCPNNTASVSSTFNK